MKINLLFSIPFFAWLKSTNSAEIEVFSKDKRECCADRVNAIMSNIAIQAAREAKAAEDAQYSAGRQASHQIKKQLAEKAFEAANAAQAAAAAKTALVNELSRERDAVKMVMMELTKSKTRLEQAIVEELKALQGQKSVLKVLLTALSVADSTSSNADSTLRGIQDDLVEKERVLQSALQRTNTLARVEACATQDVATTKFAARKAVMAASEAKANAMRAKRIVTF